MEIRSHIHPCYSLDNGLVAAAGINRANIASLKVHADLLKSGFLPNKAQCVWGPLRYYLARNRN